jgi:hypothetical protein
MSSPPEPEPLGAETLVHVESPRGPATLRLDASENVPEEGSEIGLRCEASRIFRFDPSGLRIR